MRRYVKGFIFLLLVFLLFERSWALVIGPVVLVSAVKVIVTLASILAVPLSGIVHFFIKGSVTKKILILLVTLVVVVAAAYFFLVSNIRTQEIKFFNVNSDVSATDKDTNIKGFSDKSVDDVQKNYLSLDDAPEGPIPFKGFKPFRPRTPSDITTIFIERLVVIGTGASLILSVFLSLLGAAFFGLKKERYDIKNLMLKSLSIGTFFGFIVVFVFLIVFVGKY